MATFLSNLDINSKSYKGGVPEPKPSSSRKIYRSSNFSNTDFKESFLFNKYDVPVRERINVKLIWNLHGSEAPIASAPPFSDVTAINSKRNIPKQTFGPCNFDALRFLTPSGRYLTGYHNILSILPSLICKNQIKTTYDKVPNNSNTLKLRNMFFAVFRDEPEWGKEAFGVYLCNGSRLDKLLNFNNLLELVTQNGGYLDLRFLITHSNIYMQHAGFKNREWDLVVSSCRVYQPNASYINGQLVDDRRFAPWNFIQIGEPKRNRFASISRERANGLTKQGLLREEKYKLADRVRVIRGLNHSFASTRRHKTTPSTSAPKTTKTPKKHTKTGFEPMDVVGEEEKSPDDDLSGGKHNKTVKKR